MSELKNNCCSGCDNIPVNFLKPVAEEIASPIIHIIHSSTDKEIFPDSWKVARVCDQFQKLVTHTPNQRKRF